MIEPIFNLGDFVRVKNTAENIHSTVSAVKISQKHPTWKYRVGENAVFFDESDIVLVSRKVTQPDYDGIGRCSSGPNFSE